MTTHSTAEEEWSASELKLGLLPHVIDTTSKSIPPNAVRISGKDVLMAEETTNIASSRLYSSRIFRGGIHLHRLTPFKDLLIPSGPLSGWSGTAFNLGNATIGAGLLAFGSIFAGLGVVLGPALSLVVLIAQITSNGMLLRSAEWSKSRSFSVLAYRNFGLVGSSITDIVVFISGFGGLCAYLVLLVDFVQPTVVAFISPTSILATERVVTLLVVVLAGVLPLSLKRSLNALEGFSVVSVLLVILIVIGVTVLCAIDIANGFGIPSEEILLGRLDLNAFSLLPTLFFAFSNTTAVFPIYVEMKQPTRRRFGQVQILSGIVVLFAYVLAGAMTYVRYGDDVKSNFLNNFSTTETVPILMRLAFSFTLITTYPLVMFPTRLAVEHLFLGIKRQFSALEFSLTTVLIAAGTFGVAAATDDVGIVFGLTGSVGTSLLSFVLPALIYWRASFIRGWGSRGCLSIYRLAVAVLLGLFGLAAGTLGVVAWASEIGANGSNSTNITNATRF
jgi:amino acid permease